VVYEVAVRVAAVFCVTFGVVFSGLGALYDVPKMASRLLREYRHGACPFLPALGSYMKAVGIGIGKPLASIIVPHTMFSGPDPHATLKLSIGKMLAYFPNDLAALERQCGLSAAHVANWRGALAESLAQALPRTCPRAMYHGERADFSTFDFQLFKPALEAIIHRTTMQDRPPAANPAAPHERAMAPILAPEAQAAGPGIPDLEHKPLDLQFHVAVHNAMCAAKARLAQQSLFWPREAMYKTEDIILMDATYVAVLDLAILYLIQKCHRNEAGNIVLLSKNVTLEFSVQNNVHDLFRRFSDILTDYERLEAASDGLLAALEGLLCHRTDIDSSIFGRDVHTLYSKIGEMRMQVLDQICMKSPLNNQYPQINLSKIYE